MAYQVKENPESLGTLTPYAQRRKLRTLATTSRKEGRMADDIEKTDEAEANRYVAACKTEAPLLGRFYDWLCAEEFIDRIESDDARRPEQIIADFLEIDLEAVERHRVRILDALANRAHGESDS